MLVNYPGGSMKFVYTNGQLSVDGVHIEMTPSSNSMYPSSDGWMKFSYKEMMFYFKKSAGGSFKLEMVQAQPQVQGMRLNLLGQPISNLQLYL